MLKIPAWNLSEPCRPLMRQAAESVGSSQPAGVIYSGRFARLKIHLAGTVQKAAPARVIHTCTLRLSP